MLIGIEASRANKPKKTGVEWYAWHLIREMKDLTKIDGNSWILYSDRVLSGGLEILPENWFDVRARWPLPYGWTQFRLSWELWRRKVDVAFFPGSTLPRYGPPKTVVTVHDVGFHRFPKLYKSRQVHIHEAAMRDIRRRAARIVTVSEFSGREIVDAYGIDPSRIAITPNGVDHELYRPITDAAAIEGCLRRHRIGQPFFVAVGRLEAKKNTVNLVRAFTLFKSRRGIGDPYRLILAGIPGFGYDAIRKEIDASAAKSDIREIGYVPELDMPYLLNAAEALIHPSFYEGFGIPPLMAMACGCAVLFSDVASLPEVVGSDAGLAFSPGSVEEMANAMARIADERELKERLRAAGIRRAALFTWKHTAELTRPVLTEW